jgi:hypothetical protein
VSNRFFQNSSNLTANPGNPGGLPERQLLKKPPLAFSDKRRTKLGRNTLKRPEELLGRTQVSQGIISKNFKTTTLTLHRAADFLRSLGGDASEGRF